MLKKFYISEKYFTLEEINAFNVKFGYALKEIDYSSGVREINFSNTEEKEFLLQKGYPKILARFFS